MLKLPGTLGSNGAGILPRPLGGVIWLGPKSEALPCAAGVAAREPVGTGPEVTGIITRFLPSPLGH